MPTTITFANPINSSLQLGDTVYYATDQGNGITSKPLIAGNANGQVIAINGNSINITGELTIPGNAYFLFAKSIYANETSLKGYWADVKFVNNSNEKIELFAISSEVIPSSK
jgi:hypothetical protein